MNFAGSEGGLRLFTARADALFDVIDGLCTPITVGGVAYVSLAPGARRGHGAAYVAVAAGRIDSVMSRDVLAGVRPGRWQPDFAVDTTVWMRNDAECSPQRGFSYHPSRHSAGQPIVAGWCYSWLVGLSAGADSWTAPLDSRRVLVGENPDVVAAQQIRQRLPRLGRLMQPAQIPAASVATIWSGGAVASSVMPRCLGRPVRGWNCEATSVVGMKRPRRAAPRAVAAAGEIARWTRMIAGSARRNTSR